MVSPRSQPQIKVVSPDCLECEQFSVINGAQTVRSLMKAHKLSPREAGDAKVLLRVTTVTLKEKDAVFLDNITKYNNTQNTVRVSDFGAMTLFSVRLTSDSHGWRALAVKSTSTKTRDLKPMLER